ncbi:MAG: HD domain-containing protein [Candidatus Sumerlaeota bacterium]|nr:HD domain-containing protein [Candidatus Sumerlaeota bacterium]
MEGPMPTREDALALLKEFNDNPALVNHALAVEAVMRHIARKRGRNEEEWGLVGLIHDLDYEKFPERHCSKTREILEQRGWPQWIVRAAVSHGWGICSAEEPTTDLEKTLYAIDELTGLVAACALVRPSKSVMDLEAASVKKKWKMKAFAAGANREIIAKGAEMLGADLTELITDAIMGMREVASQIGLGLR